MRIEEGVPGGPLTCWPANHDEIEEAIRLLMSKQIPRSLLLIFEGKQMECLVHYDEVVVKGSRYPAWELIAYSNGQRSRTTQRLHGFSRPRAIAKACFHFACEHRARVYADALEAMQELGE